MEVPTTILCGIPGLNDADGSKALRHLSLMDAIIVSKICVESKAIVDGYLETTFLSMLRPFVDSPEGLVDCMDGIGSVVSGDLVLWFLLGGSLNWVPETLDIYCSSFTGVRMVGYLQSCEGYVHDTTDGQHDSVPIACQALHPSVASVTHLINRNSRRIDVVESSSPSVLHPLSSFWTTLLPNYISARTLCLAYPYHTLATLGCFTRVPGVPFPAANELERWAALGFEITDFKSNVTEAIARVYPKAARDCADNPYCPHNFRSFGDKWCLQYTFRSRDGEPPEKIGDLVPEWRYGGDECGSCDRQSNWEIRLVAH